MPKQNRPMVRDGRLQTPKKRTDRSYLPGAPGATDETPESLDLETYDDENALPEDVAAKTETETAIPEVAPSDPTAAFAAPELPSAATRVHAASHRLPTAVRAIQQQGVRKRREVDLHALAVRDTNYALHELRRILILTVMVIATLVVLTFALR